MRVHGFISLGLVVVILLFALAVLFIITHPPQVNQPTQATVPVTTTDTSTTTTSRTYTDPVPVTIQGYTGSAEVPVITPDGQYLVWDNRTDPGTPDINIYYAKRIDDTTFKFMGEVGGVNEPGVTNFEMVIDNDNNFYFSRIPAPGKGRGNGMPNIYRGLWNNGTVTDVAPVSGIHPNQVPNTIDDSPSPSPDGKLLIFNTENFTTKCMIYKVAIKNTDGSFIVLGKDDPRMEKYTQEWQSIYGTNHFNQCLNLPGPGPGPFNPVIGPLLFSHSGLEAVFTILDWEAKKETFYLTTRSSLAEPFGKPQLLISNGRVVEGGSFSPDDSHIYFHFSNPNGTFSPYVVSKRAVISPAP